MSGGLGVVPQKILSIKLEISCILETVPALIYTGNDTPDMNQTMN